MADEGLLGFLNTPAGLGLLSAAAGGLAGARRNTPWNNFGRAGVAGLVGYSQAQDDAARLEQQKQQMAMQDLQQRHLNMQLDQAAQDQKNRQGMQDFFKSQYQPGQEGYTAQVPSGNPFDTQNPPSEANNFGISQVPIPAKPPTFGGKPIDPVLGGMLPYLDPKEAIGMLQKVGPKVKDWKPVNVNGKVLYAPLMEDGSVGSPVPYGVAEKAHFADTGGGVQGLDPYTGAPIGAPITKTQSPESIASNKVAWANYGISKDRLNYDKQQGGKPQFNADAGGFIYPPSQTNPQGGIVKVPGFAPKMNDTQAGAAGYADRMQQSEYVMSNPDLKASQKPEKIAQTFKAIPSFGLGEAIGNQLETAPRQQVRQAQEDWVRAKLRKESGAVIGPKEMDDEIKTYFPQIGDSDAVIKQKTLARETARKALERQAGPTYKTPSDRTKVNSILDQADAILGGR